MPAEHKNPLNIYSLDHLKPEVVAVAFAKCSRSPESFKDIADELTDEKSADFHEKWVVGYGHSSVAEHATLHLAIENVSILATKAIEDNRLASYTEKSTRYQIFDRDKYYQPASIMSSKFAHDYETTLNYIFDAYARVNEPMRNFIIKKYPKDKDYTSPKGGLKDASPTRRFGGHKGDLKKEQSDKVYYNVITKARVCDNTRYLLPAATLTNLGMTVNARALEHAIVKLLSHPLEEMRLIGERLKEESLQITPTLIKFANANEYLQKTNEELANLAKDILTAVPESVNPVEIVDYDHDAENKLVAGLLYRHSIEPYKQIYAQVKKMTAAEKEKVIDTALKYRSDYDQPLRELETIYYTFDILMDYGAFRDIQRHRMATQINQKVTVVHGYETPEEIIEAGLEKDFKSVMDAGAELYNKLSPEFPDEAQYVVPLAFRKRTLFTWNLRELHHFISLRSGHKGHISYRRITQACWQKLNEIQPLIAKYIRVNLQGGSDSWASTMFKPEYNYMPKK